MQKRIIAVDFDGALLKHRPFELAHKRWFELFSELLKDSSLKRYGTLKDYFPKVEEIMQRYLGDIAAEDKIRFARDVFAMVMVAEARQDDLVMDFADYLKSIKKSHALALITTAPEGSARPILEKLGCNELFDMIDESPLTHKPDKKKMFKEFMRKYGKPEFYIGDGDEHITACKELEIRTISVNWVSKARIKGDHDIKSVKELAKIIELQA